MCKLRPGTVSESLFTLLGSGQAKTSQFLSIELTVSFFKALRLGWGWGRGCGSQACFQMVYSSPSPYRVTGHCIPVPLYQPLPSKHSHQTPYYFSVSLNLHLICFKGQEAIHVAKSNRNFSVFILLVNSCSS